MSKRSFKVLRYALLNAAHNVVKIIQISKHIIPLIPQGSQKVVPISQDYLEDNLDYVAQIDFS